MQESKGEFEEVMCSGNVAYGGVIKMSNRFESKEDCAQDEDDYL